MVRTFCLSQQPLCQLGTRLLSTVLVKTINSPLDFSRALVSFYVVVDLILITYKECIAYYPVALGVLSLVFLLGSLRTNLCFVLIFGGIACCVHYGLRCRWLIAHGVMSRSRRRESVPVWFVHCMRDGGRKVWVSSEASSLVWCDFCVNRHGAVNQVVASSLKSS